MTTSPMLSLDAAETKLRDDFASFAKSMFDRGLTPGNSGNISARLADGRVLMTPTGSSFGRLDPARISLLDAELNHIGGDAPTKEIPLHSAFYETRAQTGAVVHLHSCHSVALSILEDTDADDMLPPLTAYGVMKLGRVKLLPFFMPGDPKMGEAVRALGGKRSAVVLAHHGPVVAGLDLESACYAMEELEETAKLAMMTRGLKRIALSDDQVGQLVQKFKIEW